MRKKKKHVVHIVEGLGGGGVLTFLYNIVNHSPKTEFTIVYGLRNDSYLSENIKHLFRKGKVHFIYWKYAQRNINGFNDLRALYRLWRIVKQCSKESIFHLHSSKAGVLGRIVCLFAQRHQVIYTPHGISYLSAENLFIQYFYIVVEKLFSFFPSKMICVSKSESNALKRLRIRSKYIYNGLAPIEGYNKTSPKYFTIVNSGRILFQKDPLYFNTIAKRFEHNPKIKFIWIGDGPLKHTLTSKNITITGWLSQNEIYKIYSESSVYLSSSRYEGLSYAILEAMALRLPLILRNSIGNVDMVNNNKNGLLFSQITEVEKAINAYMDNPPLAEAKGRKSYEIFIKKFNLKNCIKQYQYQYEQLL